MVLPNLPFSQWTHKLNPSIRETTTFTISNQDATANKQVLKVKTTDPSFSPLDHDEVDDGKRDHESRNINDNNGGKHHKNGQYICPILPIIKVMPA
jgi:hypothetical protein